MSVKNSPTAELCSGKALEAFECVVADRPNLTPEALTAAVRHVIVLRDALIAERRDGNFGPRRQQLLDRTNSILSLSASSEFPIFGVRWERITAVRDALRQLTTDECSTRGSGDEF